MSFHFLLQGIFLTHGSHPGLLHCRQILHHLSFREVPGPSGKPLRDRDANRQSQTTWDGYKGKRGSDEAQSGWETRGGRGWKGPGVRVASGLWNVPGICVVGVGISLQSFSLPYICLKYAFICACFMIRKVFKKRRGEKKKSTTLRPGKRNPSSDKRETFRSLGSIVCNILKSRSRCARVVGMAGKRGARRERNSDQPWTDSRPGRGR